MKNMAIIQAIGKVFTLSATLALSITSPALADTTLDKYQDILIAPKARPVVRKAATDLQYHLERIAGRKFPLVESMSAPQDGMHFIVGSGVLQEQEANISNMPREGWMMRSVPNGLLLAGDEKNPSSMNFYHAVSLFLEKHCGVRWVWPGESGEVIPQNPKLNIPTLTESGAPPLKRRSLALNYGRFWHPQVKEHQQVWWGRTRQGDQFRAVFGHSWWGTMPPDEYFKEHPEWFGLVGGKRTTRQLCPSNMEMRDEFVKRLLSRPDYKSFNIISVSANDGGGFCECHLCKAKGADEPLPIYGREYQNAAYWDFVNDIAGRVKKLRPELGIGTFAYTISRTPPKRIDQLPDNVYLSMTTYSTQMMIPEEKAKYQAFIDEWKTKGVKIVMREYWGMHYWLDLPILYPDEIADTIKQGVASGAIASYGETGKHFSTQAPNYYVLTHTLWDPTADTSKLLDEFYSTFGPAAKPVRAYYEYLEGEVTKAWNKYKFTPGLTELLVNYGDIFNPEVMAKAATYLDEAKRVAGDDAKLQQRVDFVRIGCEYTTVMGEMLGLYDKIGRSGLALPTYNPLLPYPELSKRWTAASPEFYQFVQRLNTVEGRAAFERQLNGPNSYTPAQRGNFGRFLERMKSDQDRPYLLKQVKEPFSFTPAQQKAWLERAWELGQQRIELLNSNRLNFALDEGLYAQTVEAKSRPWHPAIAKLLGKSEDEIVTLEYTHPVKKAAATTDEVGDK
jgi:hypothetical protein